MVTLKAKLCTFWVCVWHPNFTGDCFFFFKVRQKCKAI